MLPKYEIPPVSIRVGSSFIPAILSESESFSDRATSNDLEWSR